MASSSSIPLSSKLAATASQGFALKQCSEANYRFEWHHHDCAMLLWAQTGALDSRWVADGSAQGQDVQGLRLVRNTALLLPVHAVHSTRSGTPRQRHGELYLRAEMLGDRIRWGAFRLDGASLAMLDALSAPVLAPGSAEPLVQALMAQLAARNPAQWLQAPPNNGPLSRRMLRCFTRALEQETPLPSIEAVASELGVSVRNLQRACVQELGASPVAMRRRVLAAQARALIAQGMTPAQAARQLGFAHGGHLARLLREVPE